MENSILNFVKKAVGVPVDYTAFDDEIIADINTAFAILYQLGKGDAPFRISDSSALWTDYISDSDNLDEVKTYVRHRVKLAFDPPASGILVELLERQCREFECRVSYEVDPKKEVNQNDDS